MVELRELDDDGDGNRERNKSRIEEEPPLDGGRDLQKKYYWGQTETEISVVCPIPPGDPPFICKITSNSLMFQFRGGPPIINGNLDGLVIKSLSYFMPVSATYVVSRISKKDTRMWKKLLEDDVEIEKAKIYPDVLDFWKTIMKEEEEELAEDAYSSTLLVQFSTGFSVDVVEDAAKENHELFKVDSRVLNWSGVAEIIQLGALVFGFSTETLIGAANYSDWVKGMIGENHFPLCRTRPMYAIMLQRPRSKLLEAFCRSHSLPVYNRHLDLLCNTENFPVEWVHSSLKIIHASGGYVLLTNKYVGKKWLYVVNPTMKQVKDVIRKPTVADSSNYYNLCHDPAETKSTYKILWFVCRSDSISLSIYNSELKTWTPVEFKNPISHFPIPFEGGVYNHKVMYWLKLYGGGAGVKFNMNIREAVGEPVTAMNLPAGEDRFLYLGNCAANLFLVGCRYEPGIGCAVTGCGCNEVWTVYMLSKDEWLKLYTIGKERFPNRLLRVHDSGWRNCRIVSIVKPASPHIAANEITEGLKLVYWYGSLREAAATCLVWFDFVTKSASISLRSPYGHFESCFPLNEFLEMNPGPAEEDGEVARAQLMMFGKEKKDASESDRRL